MGSPLQLYSGVSPTLSVSAEDIRWDRIVEPQDTTWDDGHTSIVRSL